MRKLDGTKLPSPHRIDGAVFCATGPALVFGNLPKVRCTSARQMSLVTPLCALPPLPRLPTLPGLE